MNADRDRAEREALEQLLEALEVVGRRLPSTSPWCASIARIHRSATKSLQRPALELVEPEDQRAA